MTPEFARDYKASFRDGGPARGFSSIMPAFSGVLTSAQMDDVIVYVRSLCKEKGWPLGELNVPRALAMAARCTAAKRNQQVIKSDTRIAIASSGRGSGWASTAGGGK